MHNITLITGDGIGPEICEVMKKVIKASGVEINWEEVVAGEKAIEEFGNPLPDYVIESIKKNKVAIKGPITTPVGKGFRSVNVGLRKSLNLYANVRPIKTFKGIKSRYEDIDLVVVRENTEGLYSGIEHKVADFAGESIKVITKPACDNIIEFAYDYCVKNGYKKLTGVHKANIMKISDGLFLDRFYCAKEKHKENLDIVFDDMIVDATAMNMVLDPSQFEVMVMPNLYGDILSDLGAGLVGGLGMIPSANIGKDCAVFEAVHGSAPMIAGKNLANPTAIILSAIMMLRHIGEVNAADKILDVIIKIFEEGKVLTTDLGGDASTKEFGDYICSKL